MGAFVLATAGRADLAGHIEATQVFEKLMLLLLSEGFWPHGLDASSGPGLCPNDGVLFGLTDGPNLQIVGDAVVAAGSTVLSPQRLGQVRMYLGPALPPDPLAFTHSAVLTQLNLRDQPLGCAATGTGPSAEVVRELGGELPTGAVRPVSAVAFEAITGRMLPEMPRERLVRPTPRARPAPESHSAAKEFVLSNLELVDFGGPLPPPARREVSTPAGAIDVVCESDESPEVVAVMWANGEPPAEVLAAAHERLMWLRHDLGDDGRHVRGVILTLDGTGELDAGEGEDISVRRVRVCCEPVRSPEAAERTPPVEGVQEVSPAQAPALVRMTPIRSDLDFAAKCLQVPRTRR